MTRRHLLPVLFALALVMTGTFALAWAPGLRGDVTVAEFNSDAIVAELFQFDGPIRISVTYLDIVDTLEELIADADLIAIVRVVARRQYSPISVAVTASVVRVVKGQEAIYTGAVIRIGQTGNLRFQHEYLLAEGREYMLFLGRSLAKQADGQPHTFFIRSGERGVFYAEGEQIAGRDPRFVAKLRQAAVSGGLAAMENYVKAMLRAR